MNRNDLINTYFQRKNDLTPENPVYAKHITDLFQWALRADDVANDKAAKLFNLEGNGIASVVSKQKGIIAGIEEINFLLTQQTKLQVFPKITDGSWVTAGKVIIEMKGSNNDLLAFERSILNILGRMSGIATYTHTLVSNMKNGIFLAATRKTPLLFLDKKAVAIGGGLTHRLNLADWALIKDNHLAILKKELNTDSSEKVIEEAVRRIINASVAFFEIEVETQSQADAALTAFELAKKEKATLAILLDNFDQHSAAQCIDTIKKSPIYKRILVEVSGGITQENLPSWVKAGVDILSMGSLTHSSPAFDFSMEIR